MVRLPQSSDYIIQGTRVEQFIASTKKAPALLRGPFLIHTCLITDSEYANRVALNERHTGFLHVFALDPVGSLGSRGDGLLCTRQRA
jgi:hypothetical protein